MPPTVSPKPKKPISHRMMRTTAMIYKRFPIVLVKLKVQVKKVKKFTLVASAVLLQH